MGVLMTQTEDQNLTKEWKNATLANNFIFYKVMRHHRQECKHLIEMLLNVKIKRMEMHNEEVIDVDHDAKGIRLDIYVKEKTSMYDIELQVADTAELPERSRFYSAIMSVDTLQAGDHYKTLRDSHVIFICMEDIFDKGLPVYTFEYTCQEDGKTKLNDRDYRHFFIAPNCAKMIKDKELKAFFEFLISGKPDSKFTEKLKVYVEDAKQNTQWRMQYMTLARLKTYAYDQGRIEKAVEDALVLINDFNAAPEVAAKKMNAPLEKVLAALGKIKSN